MFKYSQLLLSERIKIYEGLKNQMSIRAISALIDRFQSTVCREIAKNSDHIGYLYPRDAHHQAMLRKAKHPPKIDRIAGLKEYLIEKLKAGWSPIAIAGRWSRDNPLLKICHESIYSYVYAAKNKALGLWKLLPRRKKKRGFMRKTRSVGCIKNRVSIHKRPEQINDRITSGHFEADLFFNKGSQSANVLNSIERVSRKIFLVHNPSKTSSRVIHALKTSIGSLASSVTFDNGSEFSRHEKLQEHEIDTYFCDPGSPWQKGSVEHSNGLIRRFLPFKTNYKEISQELLDKIAEVINNIPRKSLNFLTPNEVFDDFCQKSSSVALQN